MYGMISALLLRSGEMGEDIAEALGYLGFPLPGGPFQVVLFSLDDPRIGALRGRIRHNCRVNMYAALRDHLAERLQYKTQGWLVMLMGYLFGIFYTGGDDTVVARVCGESVGYAKDVLGFDVHVTISNPWEGVDKVESAYRIIQDAEHSREFYTGVMDRVFIIPSDALQRIVDRDQRTQFEQTFFQSAERVCGAVQAGDCQASTRATAKNCGELYWNALSYDAEFDYQPVPVPAAIPAGGSESGGLEICFQNGFQPGSGIQSRFGGLFGGGKGDCGKAGGACQGTHAAAL